MGKDKDIVVRGYSLMERDIEVVSRLAKEQSVSDSAALRMIIRKYDELMGSSDIQKAKEIEDVTKE